MRSQGSSSESFFTIVVIVLALILMFMYFKSTARTNILKSFNPSGILR